AMMQMMNAPTPEGGQMPMMAMVAKVVGSTCLGGGWAYQLFNSVVIAAIFVWLLGNRAVSVGSGLTWALWDRVVDRGRSDPDAPGAWDVAIRVDHDAADADGGRRESDRSHH